MKRDNYFRMVYIRIFEKVIFKITKLKWCLSPLKAGKDVYKEC
jgi:hypothetical protein